MVLKGITPAKVYFHGYLKKAVGVEHVSTQEQIKWPAE